MPTSFWIYLVGLMFHLPILIVWQSRVSPNKLGEVVNWTFIGVIAWPFVLVYALGVGYVKLCRGS